MLELMLESPWPALIVTGIIALVLISALLRSGEVKWLIAAVVALIVGGAAILLERYVVTEREQVEQTLDEIAALAVKNDVPGVVAHLVPEAREIQRLAEAELAHVTIREVKLGDLNVDVDAKSSPPKATAKFIARVEGSDKRGTVGHNVFIQRMEVGFEKRDGRWLVSTFKEKGLK